MSASFEERLARLEEEKDESTTHARIELIEFENKDLSTRLARLEATLGELSGAACASETRRSATKESDLAVSQAQPTERSRSKDKEMGAQATVYTSQDLKGFFRSQRPFSESIWDCSVFIGMPVIGPKIPIALSFLVNFALQGLFCVIIAINFGTVSVPTIESAKLWRLTDAHHVNNMDSVHHWSLAARVCAGDPSLSFSSTQRTLVMDINDYTDKGMFGLSIGSLLCLMVLILWWMSVLVEIQDALELIMCVIVLPRGKPTLFHRQLDSCSLKCVSKSRVVWTAFIVTCRVGVALSLGVSGSLWLCRTTDLKNLVLNAAALHFVLDIDELIFTAWVPMNARAALANTEPLPVISSPSWRGISVRRFLSIALCFGVTLAFFIQAAIPVNSSLQALRAELCERGSVDFAVGQNVNLAIPLVVNTSAFTDSVSSESIERSWFQTVVQEVLNKTNASDVEWADQVFASANKHDNIFDFQAAMQGRPETQPAFRCEDQLTNPALLRLRSTFEDYQARECADFKEHCGERFADSLRYNCPVTCGCDLAFSGLVFTSGCPNTCLELRGRRARASPCRDVVNPTNNSSSDNNSTNDSYFIVPRRASLRMDGGLLYSESPLEGLQKFWSKMTQTLGLTPDNPFYSPDVPDGCRTLFESPATALLARVFCRVDDNLGSTLQHFCPEICGCDQLVGEDVGALCPLSCSSDPEVVSQVNSCHQGLCPQKTLLADAMTEYSMDGLFTCGRLDSELVQPAFLDVSLIEDPDSCVEFRMIVDEQCCEG